VPAIGGVQLRLNGVGVTEPVNVAVWPIQIEADDIDVAEKEGVVDT
jgi:hypothetical protein